MALQVGDTVRLKSGGPLMTVESTDYSNGAVNCIWFCDDENKAEPKTHVFPQETLTKED